MSDADLNQLRATYKKATDDWVDTIRAEEALAARGESPDARAK
jgi:hypothetical protein